MYPILLALALVLSAPVPWVKGDVVYVSATLTHVDDRLTFIVPVFVGETVAPSISELPACTPLTVTATRWRGKPHFLAKDAAGGGVVLTGPWEGRKHRSREACLEALASLGEPTVIHSLYRHELVP